MNLQQYSKEQLTKYNRKLSAVDLVNLYDLNFSESNLRTANFNENTQKTIQSYIKFENESESLDEMNEHHNYGRLVIVPLSLMMLNSFKIKHQKKILFKTIKSLAFVPEFKRCSNFFAWIENDSLMIVFIERCLIKEQWTPKNTWYKSSDFFWTAILKVQNELTRFSKLYDVRANISNQQDNYITNLLKKIFAIGNEWKILKSIFTIDTSEFDYRLYIRMLKKHPKLKL